MKRNVRQNFEVKSKETNFSAYDLMFYELIFLYLVTFNSNFNVFNLIEKYCLGFIINWLVLRLEETWKSLNKGYLLYENGKTKYRREL